MLSAIERSEGLVEPVQMRILARAFTIGGMYMHMKIFFMHLALLRS